MLTWGRLRALKMVLDKSKPEQRPELIREVGDMFRVRGRQRPTSLPGSHNRWPRSGNRKEEVSGET
ncbi:hypothetical protein UO65_5432 [Actinokineospora spheciospongiae]|uniref:Uncharacterized protein n=1 Tax=Actinokineospora spheciospongiae TaxID=909613 RepID=W7IEJ4_9PSEU|nr:hypothetical protein UO65_5432 [Actinokineospora spheciospongiae]